MSGRYLPIKVNSHTYQAETATALHHSTPLSTRARRNRLCMFNWSNHLEGHHVSLRGEIPKSHNIYILGFVVAGKYTEKQAKFIETLKSTLRQIDDD